MYAPSNKLVKIPEELPDDYINEWIMSEKGKMHLGTVKGLNYNIVRIARHIRPQFAIIDGVTGMARAFMGNPSTTV